MNFFRAITCILIAAIVLVDDKRLIKFCLSNCGWAKLSASLRDKILCVHCFLNVFKNNILF